MYCRNIQIKKSRIINLKYKTNKCVPSGLIPAPHLPDLQHEGHLENYTFCRENAAHKANEFIAQCLNVIMLYICVVINEYLYSLAVL